MSFSGDNFSQDNFSVEIIAGKAMERRRRHVPYKRIDDDEAIMAVIQCFLKMQNEIL